MAKTELRTEVEIAAPAEHVYGVLCDFPRYPEWNPFITAISGKLVVGEPLQVDLSLPEGNSYVLKPRLTALRADGDVYELRWRGTFWLPALLEAEHIFTVTELAAGRCRFAQGENFSGFLLRFAGHTLTLTARGFVYMNQALKKRAEATFQE
jgi:hypothetical protein